MENNENLGSQEPVSNSNPVKSVNVKLIGIIAVVVAVILVVFFMFFTRSAKSTVKDYIKAMSKADAKKVMALMDYEGAAAFSSTGSYSSKGYTYDFEKFEDNYDEIMDKMKDMDKDEKEAYKELKEKAVDSLQDELDEMKDEDVKFTVKKIKTEKVDDCKKLTKVICDIEVKADGEKETMEDVEFYTMKKGMKHYIVSAGM